MTSWTPIILKDLYEFINLTENELNGELLNFWNLIKVEPKKWSEGEYGSKGGGFWVVAVCGSRAIWYNDIEEGFNITTYTTYGKLDEYYCNQEELRFSVLRLFNLVKFGGEVAYQRGKPEAEIVAENFLLLDKSEN
jgi:hypothetical protein